MPGKRIDHSRVRCARLHGLPNSLIAERLNCSVRQVQRINSELYHEPIDELAGTEFEFFLYASRKRLEGKSLREIAYAFCVSHEHVRKQLEYINQEAA